MKQEGHAELLEAPSLMVSSAEPLKNACLTLPYYPEHSMTSPALITDLQLEGHSGLSLVEAGPTSRSAGTYFLCSESWNGFPCPKRWNIYSESVMKSHGLPLDKFIKQTWDDTKLERYPCQGFLPLGAFDSHDFKNSTDPVLFRLWLASLVRGRGIEFGAGANPFPVPMHSATIYVDRFARQSLANHAYPGQELSSFVSPHIIADMSDMSIFGDSSFDYIVASHVIEHLSNPINAIVQAHRVLKNGGHLLLAIPSKDRTFDRLRPLTSLSHLIEDYEQHSRINDFLHYKEWFSLVHPLSQDSEVAAKDAWMKNLDIHYHVYSADSFKSMADWIQAHCAQFSKYEVLPEVNDSSVEFYAVFTK